MRKTLIIATLITACVSAVWATQGTQLKITPKELTLEKLFRVKPYMGTAPRTLEFSKDGRYLAYLWNTYEERGTDLWLYDTKTGKVTRVTSLEIMKQFDAPEEYQRFVDKDTQKKREDEIAQKIYETTSAYIAGKDVDLSAFEKTDIEQLKKEVEERKRIEAQKKEEAKKLAGEEKDKDTAKQEETEKKEKSDQDSETKSDDARDEKKDAKKDELKEDWQWRDELKKKKEKEKVKPDDLYPGVKQVSWSPNCTELLFEYRGDLYLFRPAKGNIERLTMTEAKESIADWTDDGKTYFYRVENKVFAARLDSPKVIQINHEPFPEYKYTGKEKEKEDKYKLGNTNISPNGKWMVIITEKTEEKPSEKEVQYMSYQKRWAEPVKTKRETPDDTRVAPERRFYLQQVNDGRWNKIGEPVFVLPGGNVWTQAVGFEWSKDSTKYAFATWDREKNKLKVYVGKAIEGDKPSVVYENKASIGRDTAPVLDPKFTPDGKKLVVILDESGYRQPFAIDLATKTLTQLIKGDFEAFPILEFTPDSSALFVTSNKQSPAMRNIYKVSLLGGEMQPLGKADGMHRATAVSENARFAASVYGNWTNRPELLVLPLDGKGATKVLTQSHDPEWDAINLLKPSIFTYKNRHDDTIYGLVFKPNDWQASDKRPSIVYMYGGPLGMGHTIESDTFNSAAYLFQMFMAAKHGYVTVCIDPRGQSGYGRKFSEANFDQVGRPQVEDLEDLVKFMGTTFAVDQSRIGLHGWSFGGFQTQMTLYTSPDTFACGIAGAGPTEWENYNSWYTGNTITKPEKGKLVMRKFSVLPFAKGLKKPLLLVHGMEDDNVLFQDTVNIYKALLEAGKERLVDLFVDPEGKHGMGVYVPTKSRFNKYEAFFLRHLGEGMK